MSDLEYVARPSVAGMLGVRPRGPTTDREPIVDGSVMIKFGSAGPNVFVANGQFKIAENTGDDREIRRKYDVVRVKNPTDNEQYVDVEVMTEYQARNRISEKRTKIRFFDVEPAENIEILRRNQTRTGSVD